VAKGSPLYHFIKVMQEIMVQGKGLSDEIVSLGVVTGCLLVCSLITAKTFKLKEG